MKELILEKLKAIEYQFDVKILYACESGSRAWGFASPDSDFDVRFIYVHTMDYYLSIDEQRDVIELPINSVLDISGWELKKALRLFRKSNATFYEWLQSPMVYYEENDFVPSIRSLMPCHFSARAAMHHYLSIAKGVLESELSGEMVRLKKYFYALRPVLAARWIVERKSVPPMDFTTLRAFMSEKVEAIVEELLTIKENVDEGFMIKRNSDLNAYIHESIRYCEARVPEARNQTEAGEINKLFKKSIV